MPKKTSTFIDSQAAIQAIIEQYHKNYHDIMITEIRQPHKYPSNQSNLYTAQPIRE